jgi:hypothetical protein
MKSKLSACAILLGTMVAAVSVVGYWEARSFDTGVYGVTVSPTDIDDCFSHVGKPLEIPVRIANGTAHAMELHNAAWSC